MVFSNTFDGPKIIKVLQKELQEKNTFKRTERNGIGRHELGDFKSINIKDIIYMVAKSFENILSSTIIKSLRKT